MMQKKNTPFSRSVFLELYIKCPLLLYTSKAGKIFPATFYEAASY